MIKEGKFGVMEAICMTTLAISVKLFFTSPSFVVRFVGPAGWYMTLISNAVSILVFTFIYLLLKRFPGKNIVEVFDISLGRPVGFLFSFIFAGAFLLTGGILLREFIDVLKVFVYPNAPLSLLAGSLVLAVAVAAFLGLESIVRMAKLFGYILLAMLIVLYLLSAQNLRLTNLFPILGYGLDKTVIHGILRSSAYEEVMIITVFAGSLQGIRNIRKVGYISLILSGLLISSSLLFFTMTFPYNVAQELTAPIYVMTRMIKYGAFVQRLDPLFLFLWNAAAFITISILLYCSVSVYCKMFRLQDTRPVVIPMSVLLFAVVMTPRDFSSIVYGTVQQLREYGWVIFYALPIVALIVAAIRKKAGAKTNEKTNV